MHQMVQDLRQLLARDVGVVLLGFLVKWGFVRYLESVGREPSKPDGKQFSRYLIAICKGILLAIIEERNREEAAGAVDARPS